MTTTAYDLRFYSTPEERYDTDMNRRVDAIIEDEGVTVIETYGGTTFGTIDPLPSENGVVIATDEINAHRIAKRIEQTVGHPVNVTLDTLDD